MSKKEKGLKKSKAKKAKAVKVPKMGAKETAARQHPAFRDFMVAKGSKKLLKGKFKDWSKVFATFAAGWLAGRHPMNMMSTLTAEQYVAADDRSFALQLYPVSLKTLAEWLAAEITSEEAGDFNAADWLETLRDGLNLDPMDAAEVAKVFPPENSADDEDEPEDDDEPADDDADGELDGTDKYTPRRLLARLEKFVADEGFTGTDTVEFVVLALREGGLNAAANAVNQFADAKKIDVTVAVADLLADLRSATADDPANDDEAELTEADV